MKNNIEMFLNEKVKIITVVIFKNGRKINTRYRGTLIEDGNMIIILKEIDGTIVTINKKHIKRIEKI